jgi:predicted DNA-binding transcriptional regulator AlpA
MAVPNVSTKYLTNEQLGEMLGIGELTIRRWRKTGMLPQPVKVGAVPLYYWPDVEKRLDELRTKGTPNA